MKTTSDTKETIVNPGKRITRGLGLLICVVALAIPALAQDYDLVIKNGRVIDPEAMFDDIANVGVTKGRIVAIIDVIDALGSERAYKKPWQENEIIHYISERRGKQFDPAMVDAALELFDAFSDIRRNLPDVFHH